MEMYTLPLAATTSRGPSPCAAVGTICLIDSVVFLSTTSITFEPYMAIYILDPYTMASCGVPPKLRWFISKNTLPVAVSFAKLMKESEPLILL